MMEYESRDPPDDSDEREHYYCPTDYGGPMESRDDEEEREDPRDIDFFKALNYIEERDECASPINCFYDETRADADEEARDDIELEAPSITSPTALQVSTSPDHVVADPLAATTPPTLVDIPLITLQPSQLSQPSQLEPSTPEGNFANQFVLSTIDEGRESEEATTPGGSDDGKLPASLDRDDVASPRECSDELRINTTEVAPPATNTSCRSSTSAEPIVSFDLSLIKSTSGLDELPYALPPVNSQGKDNVLLGSISEHIEKESGPNDDDGEDNNSSPNQFALKETISDILDATSPVHKEITSPNNAILLSDGDDFNREDELENVLHITKGTENVVLSPMNSCTSYADDDGEDEDEDLPYALDKSSASTSDSYHDMDVRRRNATEEMIRSLSCVDDRDDLSQLMLIGVVDLIQSSSSDDPQLQDDAKQLAVTDNNIDGADNRRQANDNIDEEESRDQANKSEVAVRENSCFAFDDCLSFSEWEESFRAAFLDGSDNIITNAQKLNISNEPETFKEIAEDNETCKAENRIEHILDTNIQQERDANDTFLQVETNDEDTAEIQDTKNDNAAAPSLYIKMDRNDDFEQRDGPKKNIADNEDEAAQGGASIGRSHSMQISSSEIAEAFFVRSKSLSPPSRERNTLNQKGPEAIQGKASVGRSHSLLSSSEALFIRSKSLSPLSSARNSINDDNEDEALFLSSSTNGMGIVGEEGKNNSLNVSSFIGKRERSGLTIDPDETDVLSEVSIDSAAFARMSSGCACAERRPGQC